MSETLICNMAVTLYKICQAYRQRFYPEIKIIVDKLPTALWCGLARGRFFSAGNGRDYIS